MKDKDLIKKINKEDIGILLVEEDSDYNEMYDCMFKDLTEVNSFNTVIEKTIPIHWLVNRCFNKELNKIFFNFPRKLVNFILSIPLKTNLPKAIKKYAETYRKTIVIIPNSSIYQSLITLQLLQNLKRQYKNVIWVLFYVDSISYLSSKRANEIREADFFDVIYTMDDEDAKQCSLIKFNTPYSKNNALSNIDKKTDLFYCGVGKNREKLLESIDETAKKNRVKFNANIAGYTPNIRENFKTEFLPYSNTIIKSIEANCILEVVADYQNGLTLRPYEAVCYNRKLLTNNKAIFDFDYYNPKYIHFFERVEDIDWNWVKNKEFIDYEYKENFSPLYLIEDIIKRTSI